MLSVTGGRRRRRAKCTPICTCIAYVAEPRFCTRFCPVITDTWTDIPHPLIVLVVLVMLSRSDRQSIIQYPASQLVQQRNKNSSVFALDVHALIHKIKIRQDKKQPIKSIPQKKIPWYCSKQSYIRISGTCTHAKVLKSVLHPQKACIGSSASTILQKVDALMHGTHKP